MNARYYSPKWRRFISPDSTNYLDPESVNCLNLYCYCNNDPVNYVDPSGYFGIALTLLSATGVGLVVGAGVEMGKQAYNEGNWNWDISAWNWWEIGAGALLGAATGFAFGLGGVAGGIVNGSFGALSIAGKTLGIYQSAGVLLGTAAATNFAAGTGAYALHTAGSATDDFCILKGISKGIGQTGKGLLSFFTAGMYVSSGIWNVGVGAKNALFSTLIGRPLTKFVINFVPNYFWDNAF